MTEETQALLVELRQNIPLLEQMYDRTRTLEQQARQARTEHEALDTRITHIMEQIYKVDPDALEDWRVNG